MLLQLRAAEEVAAADDYGYLDLHLDHDPDLLGQSGDDIGVDADLAATEDLTRELQHHALVRTTHPVGLPSLCSGSCSAANVSTLAARAVGSCSRDADAPSSASGADRVLRSGRLESYEPQHLDPGFVKLLANSHLVVCHRGLVKQRDVFEV